MVHPTSPVTPHDRPADHPLTLKLQVFCLFGYSIRIAALIIY